MGSVETKIQFVTALLKKQPNLVSQEFANFVLFCFCIMQIWNEQNANMFFICLLSATQKQIRWIHVGCGGQTSAYICPLK